MRAVSDVDFGSPDYLPDLPVVLRDDVPKVPLPDLAGPLDDDIATAAKVHPRSTSQAFDKRLTTGTPAFEWETVESPHWLTRDQLADYLGVTKQHVALLAMRGTGPPYLSTNGGKVQYRLTDVDAWIAAKMQTKARPKRSRVW